MKVVVVLYSQLTPVKYEPVIEEYGTPEALAKLIIRLSERNH